jgi:fatty-acyl-CoA synthase
MNEAAKPGTVPALLDEAAARVGDAAGIWWKGDLIGYASLARDSRRVAAGLLERGLTTGDHVSIWSPNCPDFLTVFFACARIGAAVAFINTRLTAAEAADLIRRTDSQALLYFVGDANGGYRGKVAALPEGLVEGLKIVVELGAGEREASGGRAATARELSNRGSLARALAQPDGSAVLYSTSGSTGPSKLVLHTHGALATHAVDAAETIGLNAPGSVLLIPFPLAGAYGTTQLLAAMAAAVPAVLLEQFEPKEAAEAIRTHGVTHINAFDEIFIKLLEVSTEERPFPTLRSCAYARFNPGYPNFVEECERRGFPLRGVYGSSETQAFFVMQPLDAPLAKRLRHGGFPASKSGAFRVRDIETGQLLPSGKSGEIEIFGPSRLKCYYGNAAATRDQILDDGYFRTGDVGHVEDDGSLVFEARLSEVLRLSGYMVSVPEIESFVEGLGGVDRCQVVGVRTDAGNRPFAFLTLKRGASFDEEAARRECERRLAKFKIPMAFHVLEAFPMGISLNAPKIDKPELTRMASRLAAKSEA